MHFDDPMYLLSQGCGIVKDVIHSNHLGKNGAIAEGVAECNQPGGDIAHHSNNLWVGGGDNKEIDTCVQDDGPTTYQINFGLLRRISAWRKESTNQVVTTLYTLLFYLHVSSSLHQRVQFKQLG